MKIIYKYIVALAFLVTGPVAQAQVANLQFATEAGGVVGGSFEVLLNISGSQVYDQGGFNIRFTYDNTALGSPVIVEAYNFNSAPYSEINLSYANGNQVSVNGAINMFAEAGTPVAKDPEWTQIVKLSFKILDENKTSNLVFLPSTDAEGTDIYSQSSKQRLETGRLENLDAPLSDQPLPVSLISFTAEQQADGQVLLQWTTATELQNKEFQVERSLNGRAFETVAVVAGAGDTNTVNHYSALDSSPKPGYNYYRLKQVDFDGGFEYSKMVSVRTDLSVEKSLVRFGPNPFKTKANISFTAAPNSVVLITLTDLSGRVIKTDKVPTQSAKTNYALFGLDALAQGIYLVRVEGAGISTSFKVMKE